MLQISYDSRFSWEIGSSVSVYLENPAVSLGWRASSAELTSQRLRIPEVWGWCNDVVTSLHYCQLLLECPDLEPIGCKDRQGLSMWTTILAQSSIRHSRLQHNVLRTKIQVTLLPALLPCCPPGVLHPRWPTTSLVLPLGKQKLCPSSSGLLEVVEVSIL